MSIGDFTPPVEYRPILDFPAYCVGSDGSVWSRWKRSGVRSTVLGRWHRLNPTTTTHGYQVVSLVRDDRIYHRFVHVLVLESFSGVRPPGHEACHYDGDRSNNVLDNLRWDTSVANKVDADRHGTRPKGERHGRSKLHREDVLTIRSLIADGFTQSTIAKRFNITQTNVSQISLRKSWKDL